MVGTVGWAVGYDSLAIDERTATTSLVGFQILGSLVFPLCRLGRSMHDPQLRIPPAADAPRTPTNIGAVTLAVFAANNCEHPANLSGGTTNSTWVHWNIWARISP